MPRRRLHRFPHRHPRGVLLYGGRSGATGIARPPGPRDAFTRLLHRLEPDPETLWDEARPMVHRTGGLLVLDDSTLGKHSAKKIDLVARHWSGKHKRVAWGINLITLVWTGGDRVVPESNRSDIRDRVKDRPHDSCT